MNKSDRVELVHGGGGEAMMNLVNRVIVSKVKIGRIFNGLGIWDLDDGASMPIGDFELVFTSDGYTINPLFFPGGDIGKLAITGTINDLSVMGAKPLAILDDIIVEEGFPVADLEKIISSIISVAESLNIAIIGGDFKVMPKGKLDKIIIASTGIGVAERGRVIRDSGLKPGDKIIVTGTVGEHEIALLSVREGLTFESNIISDLAPLWPLMEKALKVGGITAAKDPTRGGLASTLNEMAKKSRVCIWIYEDNIPIRSEVKAACEMLGLDPLYLACEGRAIIGVEASKAEEVLDAIKSTEIGKNATIIGEVRSEPTGYVVLQTTIGGKRVIEPPIGMPLPRIC
ncbi:MAG: hydrogenase expression/formation protein HypE [archaeon GB-1867-035]|nr:hydrogenase expression/formation protein HypE [Candidatus Culexmicrobium profundum]